MPLNGWRWLAMGMGMWERRLKEVLSVTLATGHWIKRKYGPSAKRWNGKKHWQEVHVSLAVFFFLLLFGSSLACRTNINDRTRKFNFCMSTDFISTAWHAPISINCLLKKSILQTLTCIGTIFSDESFGQEPHCDSWNRQTTNMHQVHFMPNNWGV
jgi:hypothetical protein